ncbi:endoglucanase, partial [Biomphalaria glabrata]
INKFNSLKVASSHRSDQVKVISTGSVKMRFCLAAVVLVFGLVRGDQLCQPDGSGVRRYNGKPCASTTRYDDGHRGSCGCGPPGGDTPFAWNLNSLTVAASQKYFDDGGDKTWCGHNCGKCVKLTPTGGFVPGLGRAPSNLNPQIFLVTNDCPVQGNEEWCGQRGKPGSSQVNSHGYEVHFDLQNHNGQVVNNLNWDNIETTWEEVGCPGDLANNYRQCECH